jgi:porphobilinogen synthase
VRENVLTVNDLILPVFVLDGENRREAVASMPGVERLTIDLLLQEAAQWVNWGSRRWRCSRSRPPGSSPWTPPRPGTPKALPSVATRALRERFPELGVITDVALGPVYHPRAGWHPG